MSRPDNVIQWRKGDYVIHYADAKTPRMLMKIVGFKRGDKTLAKCQYISRTHRRRIMLNDLKNLHDPLQFNISPEWGGYEPAYFEKICDEFDLVRRWNICYQPGQKVVTTSADGGFTTHTIGLAKMQKNGQAHIYLKRGGWWALEFVVALRDEKL